MTSLLSEAGYLQTREKLALMELRLAKLRARTDLHPSHYQAVERSYVDIMRQYLRDIKLYEIAHGITPLTQATVGTAPSLSEVEIPTKGH